jgi:hypothetical protein
VYEAAAATPRKWRALVRKRVQERPRLPECERGMEPTSCFCTYVPQPPRGVSAGDAVRRSRRALAEALALQPMSVYRAGHRGREHENEWGCRSRRNKVNTVGTSPITMGHGRSSGSGLGGGRQTADLRCSQDSASRGGICLDTAETAGSRIPPRPTFDFFPHRFRLDFRNRPEVSSALTTLGGQS